ncbi:MAG: transglycosylase domain-containing protein [Actinomycetota bacterium]|nr:transglycosylase domain-containing protein [Actinomycetota bacterium]
MSARLERQRRRRRRGGAARVIIITVSVLVAASVIAALSAVGYVVGIANSAPSLGALKPQAPGRYSTVYASDGKTELGKISNDILSDPVASDEMPREVREATVAIEDQRFYRHRGVDFEGIVRAAFKNADSGKTIQGGSTLTMQLIRTLYTGDRDRSLKRKVREAKLAEELENAHPGKAGKKWILTKYLNSVPYGTNDGKQAIGIQAAARAYFNKPASDLTLAESALLAGLPQAPSDYNPFRSPTAATARRNEVLRKMADLGYISDSEARAAIGEQLELQRNTFFREKRESFFFDYVTDALIKKYGQKDTSGGGLRIRTTIDLDLQRKARKAIAGSLSFSGAPSSAIVSINPSNGYIRAMASSAKYTNSQFNLAADGKRQPGSAFKIMALVAALREGINPAVASFPSAPLQLGPQYGSVRINCYGGKCSGGSKNLIRGTLSSDNGVYIRLALALGPKKVVKAAKDLGITSKLQGYPSETLGGLEKCCSPLEMANAYATIVGGGYRNTPKAITEVRFPDGEVDDLSKPIRKKVFSAAAMYEVVKILEMNVSVPGTGGLARTGCPVGGKTGTTDENSDAWFVGFSPRLATSTWVGFPKGRVPMGRLFNGRNVDGGTFPAQIWGRYMKAAAGKFCGKFKVPEEKFQSKAFKSANGKGSRPGERVPIVPVTQEQLEGAQRDLNEALARQRANQRAIRPGGATPQTGGNGYNPGTYVPNNPPPQPEAELDPAPSNEPQATPTDNGSATPP